MEELKFRHIAPQEIDLTRDIERKIRGLARRRPSGYVFSFSGEWDFNIPKGVDLFIVERGEDNLLGYTYGDSNLPAEDIGSVSRLCSLTSRSDKLYDFGGLEVTRKTLSKYDGYSSYTGMGNVFHLSIIEAFQYRKGIGSRLLDFVKSHNYELIELEANGFEESRFFDANGFIDTGIDAEEREQLVMVWNNPKFLKEEKEIKK